LAATTLATIMAAKRLQSALLRHFALQMVAWGAVIAAIAALGLANSALRDVAGAARLERSVWMNVGLDAGYVAVGGTLAVTGRLLARRMSLVGAGVGIAVQGLGLLVIELQFAALISR
jgi:hypothetical protein